MEGLGRLLRLDWPAHPDLGTTTLNVGTIQGGEAGNVIAPAAHALLVFRIVTEPSLLLPLLDGVIADSILSYEIITSNSPQVLLWFTVCDSGTGNTTLDD